MPVCVTAQDYVKRNPYRQRLNSILPEGDGIKFPLNDSTFTIINYVAGVCKLQVFRVQVIALQNVTITRSNKAKSPTENTRRKNNFLELHGDVTYDFFYRSAIDTPYVDNDVIQHNLRANIYATIEKTIPVVIQLNTRRSNSYLFRDYFDANVQFDGHSYQSLLKHNLKDQISEKLRSSGNDSLMYKALTEKQSLQQDLGRWLQHGKQLQQLIESKRVLSELGYYNALLENGKNKLRQEATDYLVDTLQGLKGDHATLDSTTNWVDKGKGLYKKGNISLDKSQITSLGKQQLTGKQEEALAFVKEYGEKSERFKKLSDEIKEWQEKYDSTRTATRQRIDSLKYAIDNAEDPETLQGQLKKYGDSTKQYKWVKHLMSIRRLSIGRSLVDHSELTARNISVTGVNIEYSNRMYYAISAGTVDYRYRDFIVNRVQKVPQYLLLVKGGLGKPEGNHVFLTLYQGKKQASFFDNNNMPMANRVMGLSIETRYQINQDNFLTFEIAKSSYPATAASTTNPPKRSGVFGLGDRTNEAFNIQLFSYIRSTSTRLYGQYKKQGVHFQSFNIFNYNANFNAWQVKVDQQLFRNKLSLTASVRTNEYNSPFTVYNYKSNTVLVSLQASLRLKKWPVLTTAWLPTSQLYRSGNDIVETRFSTLMASSSYLYKIGSLNMHSSVMYNRFFNEKNQQQFIYYNTQNWLFNQSFMWQRLTLNSAVSISYNGVNRLQTYDQGAQFSLNSWLRMGGGLKWNTISNDMDRLGYYGNTLIKMKKLGEIELSFDRGFLPALDKGLLSNDIGRIMYFKNF